MSGSRLEGRVAWITGGARGQGRAIATKFASEGADIVISDICEQIRSVSYTMSSDADMEETRRLVEEAGSRCVAIVADVRDQAALDEVVAAGAAIQAGVLAGDVPFDQIVATQFQYLWRKGSRG